MTVSTEAPVFSQSTPDQTVGGDAPLALIGRRREQILLDSRLDGARAGSGGALLLRGEPGIGKSALCRYAAFQAGDFQVLRSRGHESEAGVSFLALADLLQPVLHHLQSLPGPQADLLSGVLGLGPSVEADRHALAAATLGLLAVAAEERPVLAVVDDAHWLDPPSADALVFASRRLEAEPVQLLFAARERELGFDSTGLREVRVEGIDPGAAQTLLLASVGIEPARSVVERLLEATAGNPLALIEVPRALSPEQLRGEEPLPDPLPAGTALSEAFERRLIGLPDAARVALVVAACAGGGEMGAISRALRVLDLGTESLEPAEDAGLIEIGGARLEFQHPLIRSVAYHCESAATRRRAHGALSTALVDEPERRAAHLAASAVEPSERVAAELEHAGNVARERGGHACAAMALERAAQLTPSAEGRARRLVAAAAEAQLAGHFSRAARSLEGALPGSTDPELRADIQHLWGTVECLRGSTDRACVLFLGAASEVEATDRPRAAALVADAAGARVVGGDLRAAEVLLRRAEGLDAGAAGEGSPLISGTSDFVALLRGRTPPAERLLRRIEALRGEDELSPGTLPVLVWTIWCLGWTDRKDAAYALHHEIASRARAETRLGALPTLLLGLGQLELRAGSWHEASAHLSEAADLAADGSQAAVRAASTVLIARIEAARGHDESCRAHLAEAEALAAELDAAIVPVHAKAIRGLLELGHGNLDAAVVELEGAHRGAEDAGIGHPGIVPYEPDLIEAYCRVGQTGRAEEALTALEGRAARSGSSWARAAALRCRGMIAESGEFEEPLVAALREHTRSPALFDRARAELCLGERLRRERQRADARPHLRAALDAFERLGAEPWTDRTRGELGATAETARGRDADLDLLTPQELQVAMVVADGATNKEAAATLFVSPRTIDAHLQHIYRKLGLRSRHQLARAVAHQQGRPPTGPFQRVAAAPAQALSLVAALVLSAGIVSQSGVPGALFGGGQPAVQPVTESVVAPPSRQQASRTGARKEQKPSGAKRRRGGRDASHGRDAGSTFATFTPGGGDSGEAGAIPVAVTQGGRGAGGGGAQGGSGSGNQPAPSSPPASDPSPQPRGEPPSPAPPSPAPSPSPSPHSPAPAPDSGGGTSSGPGNGNAPPHASSGGPPPHSGGSGPPAHAGGTKSPES